MKGVAVVGIGAALLIVPPPGTSTGSELALAPYLPRSAHHAYGYTLAVAGLRHAPARDWLRAAERALSAPTGVELPLELVGEFQAERPAALGLSFSVPGARRVHIEVETEPAGSVPAAGPAFVDLFDASGARPAAVAAALPHGAPADPQRIETVTVEPRDYVLRVQPVIGYAGRYRVRVRTAPVLTFPVEGMTSRAILSGFGAERDGGARAHHGVDIFAPRGTPALAALDSFVTRVDTTPRGGRVVWLQPLFEDLRLYYAHLDTQRVREGDFVLAGEVVGTVGNTGNAVTTPPHLHFGVYLRRRGLRGGPQDPSPFLD